MHQKKSNSIFIYIPLALILFFSFPVLAQKNDVKEIMTPSVYGEWNKIKNVQISDNGDWSIYSLVPERGDEVLKIYNTREHKTYTFPRGENANIDRSGKYVIFNYVASFDTIRAMKRRKVDKKDMPNDSLCIYHVEKKTLDIIPNVKSYKLPDKWDGIVAYLLEPAKVEKDTLNKNLKIKKESSDNGSKLIIRHLGQNKEDTILYVKDYKLAEEGKAIAASSTGDDSLYLPGVYLFQWGDSNITNLFPEKGKYTQLTFSADGKKLAFIADLDTTKVRNRPHQLALWFSGQTQANLILSPGDSFLGPDGKISNDAEPSFSKNGNRLFFGTQPIPKLRDTLLLDDDMANVEIWTYNDSRLYTQQNVRVEDEKKRSYLALYDLDENNFVQIGSEEIAEVITTKKREEEYFLGIDDSAHLKNISWLGYAVEDLYKIDGQTGGSKLLSSNISGNVQLSPSGKYAIWYNREDSLYVVLDIANESEAIIQPPANSNFYDEENDRPMHPQSYGIAGWTKDEKNVILYDRYDLWLVDPYGIEPHLNLTNGRQDKIQYRYISLDQEEEFLPQELLISVFDEKDKSGGYAQLDLKTSMLTLLVKEKYNYTSRPWKAKNTEDLLITKESFRTFPNLLLTNTKIQNPKIFTDANPQQDTYRWGDISLFEWKGPNGFMSQGLLVKPDNFDPNKKYPLLVNFYERSSDGLHRHRAPEANRSTINYTYYANKGYVIFNPDVYYRNGHPGKSSEEAVFSGIEALKSLGFIDEKKMGVQGHSWGGYQIAHLITKTDMFACAEAGAPVVNMISAYGGIRWGSGMSRMFQYEKTQSRLGATLWEKPQLYIENSPIFNIDKVNTPVLILHNDNDGAVPWYQGIEYFVALRRLNKPAWMLNYNGEPHWPLKWENRLDFNIRMEQFFAHYLLDAAMPRWMKEGIPATLKDVETGYELID